jgi:hypothetical protein
MLVRLVLSHLLPVWLLVSSLLLPGQPVRLVLLFLLLVRLASLQPPVDKVLGPVGQRDIAGVRFAL